MVTLRIDRDTADVLERIAYDHGIRGENTRETAIESLLAAIAVAAAHDRRDVNDKLHALFTQVTQL